MTNHVIQDKLFQQLEQLKDHIAIEYRAKQVSYEDLNNKSNIIANSLLNKNISSGTFIGVLAVDKIQLITFILGILKAGCVFVPLDQAYPHSRLKAMLEETTTTNILFDEETSTELIEGLTREIQGLESCLINEDFYSRYEGISNEKPVVNYAQDDSIYIYFTSGTTGKPKAIVGQNKGLLHFVQWEIDNFNINTNTRVSQLTSQCHDPFLRDVFVPLCAGGTICIPDGKETILHRGKMQRWIEDSRVNLIHCTPGMFRIFASEGLSPTSFIPLKYILLAGEKINPKDLENWYQILGNRIQLVNMYGPTETTLAKLYYPIQPCDVEKSNIPIGKSIKGSKAIILDKYLKACNPGEVGEIIIRTPYRTKGYYNDSDLTNSKFIQNPFSDNPSDLVYRTGDLGRLLQDGNIEFVGRVDRQVKIRGYRVELSEIENKLLKHESIRECAVVYMEDHQDFEAGIGYLAAYIVGVNEISVGEIRAYLAEGLPEYMIPAHYVFLESLPLNPNGKIAYNLLPTPKKVTNRDCLGPRNKTEEKLVKIWCEILGVEQVGIDENFLQIGGTSLHIMSLVTAVFRDFQIEMPLGVIFQNPTIEGLGGYIEEVMNLDSSTSAIDLLFAQEDISKNLTNKVDFKLSNGEFKRVSEVPDVLAIENIEPFNDLYYRNCFFNAFFPVIRHFGIDVTTFLVNDLITYSYNPTNNKIVNFGLEFISIKTAEELFQDLGISVETKRVEEDIVESIVKAIAAGRPVIIGVDCFYETIRPEFYLKNNWAHNLLVYSYDQTNQLLGVIEHDNVHNLTYRKCQLSYEDTYNSFNSYVLNLPNMNHLPAYLEFYIEDNSSEIKEKVDNKKIFADNIRSNQGHLETSLENIKGIVGSFKEITFSEDSLNTSIDDLMFALNNIINGKIAEKYKVSQLFQEEDELLGYLSNIIKSWSLVRVVCERYRYSGKYNKQSFEKAISRIEDIYDMEKKYQSYLNRIIENI